MTSAVAVLEAALGLARPDKFGLSVEAVEPIILEFLDERGSRSGICRRRWRRPVWPCRRPIAIARAAMASTSAIACTTPAPSSTVFRSWRRTVSFGRPTLKPRPERAPPSSRKAATAFTFFADWRGVYPSPLAGEVVGEADG